MQVLIATSNQGKLRDFAGAAAVHGIEVEGLRDFAGIPTPVEDGATFEENARKKAEHYSRYAPGELVLADDSGLSVDALQGAPGVHSARFAAASRGDEQRAAGLDQAHVDQPDLDQANIDQANNARLLCELEAVSEGERGASFVCVISAAQDGAEVAHFRGEARGEILRQSRGALGFGYDPLFYLPALAKSFAELTPEEKALVSHRGSALRKFMAWARERAR
jgi:XTP/dITP diphosphohydrolase